MKHNPFSTRRIEAGKIPFYFEKESFFTFLGETAPGELENESKTAQNSIFLNHLYEKFVQYHYRAQIIGDHGTGKTSLIFDFCAILVQKGCKINRVSLHDRQRRLPAEFWWQQKRLAENIENGNSSHCSVAVIDGYEQLSFLEKMKVRSIFRQGKAGLLITAHKPAFQIPLLFQTQGTWETLTVILERLFRDQEGIKPPSHDLCRELLDRHQGNIRNVLFDLYDFYETTEPPLGS